MRIHHFSRLVSCGLGCCLIFLLAACGSTPSANNPTPSSTTSSGATATSPAHTTPVVTPTTVSTTAPVPPTQTGCPAAGTARAAVMAPLALGSHATIVYTVDQFKGYTPTNSTFKRYDVTTGNKTVIATLSGALEYTQISADGQWISFTDSAYSTTIPNKLQLMRMDGQGLQTLYCSVGATIQNPQWSTDQKHIVFSIITSTQETVYLLTLATGSLQAELTTSGGAGNGIAVHTWLDNTRIYLTNVPIDQPSDTLYILDTSKGPHQQLGGLIKIVANKTFGAFDSSYDGAHLFVDYGACGQGGCNPPGLITVQPAAGGTQTNILNSPQYDTTTVRAVTARTLLTVIENDRVANPSADISHNGLWKLNADGSGLTRLTTNQAHQFCSLNQFSQYPWSNVSRDGSTYALEESSFQSNNTQAISLLYGSLNGGAPTTFASVSDGSSLNIVGWTTM